MPPKFEITKAEIVEGGRMSRIVSADEARKLLNAYRAPASDRPLTLNSSEDVAMFRAAPDLAHTVARLHDILAAERGERAPEGWTWRVDANAHGYWMNPGVRAANGWPIVVRRLVTVGWSHDGRTCRDFALESIEAAVEAADRAAKDVPVRDCSSCGEGLPRGECPKSERTCGHHCNHSWSHDGCCWCGATFGEAAEEEQPANPSDG